MSKRVTHSHRADDKLRPIIDEKKNTGDASSKKFGDIQMYFYLFSCMGMSFYFAHFVLSSCGVSLGISRSYTHGLLEVVLLVTRTMNEVYHDKIGFGDWGHHLSMLYGFYLVTYVESCMPYDWLICHMQILHFPCLCWYFGCRKNSYLEKYMPNRPDLKDVSAKMFPWLMVSSSGYRTCLMTVASYNAFQNGAYVACASTVPVGLLLVYLDKGWASYFFDLLGWPSNSIMAVMYTCGVLAGIYATIICGSS